MEQTDRSSTGKAQKIPNVLTRYAILAKIYGTEIPNKLEINLDELPVKQYSEDLDKYFEFTLPVSKNIVRIKLQTPRSVDDISIRVKEFKKNHPDAADPTIVYTVKSLIDTVDGQVLDSVQLENWVRKLPMADTNYILKNAEMINKGFGIDTNITVECKECSVDYDTPFRVTTEFFGPSVEL